ncbi:MAG: TIGR02147 family protein [Myxococcota bacterium]
MLASDVFEYLDYRRLLSDFYRHKKAEGRGFSYRSFSRRAGLKSPNHLKRVIDGQRNLSQESTRQYALAMGLRGETADYFAELVRFNQSRTREEREASYERMRSFRGYRQAHQIDDRFADYHAHWYVPAIREMVLRGDFENDSHWVSSHMRPPIKPEEARRALEVLFDLGLLVEDDDGRVRQADAVVTTGPQTRGLHLRRYHRTVLERASASIELIPADERYLSALTFCVGPDGFERIKNRIQRFRNELIDLLAEEENGEEVLQLGIQLFPMTDKKSPQPARPKALTSKKSGE